MPQLPSLSDRDMELIVRRVTAEIQRQRVLTRRWRMGLSATLIAAVIATGASLYRELLSLYGQIQSVDRGVIAVEARVDNVERRPYIEGLGTPPSDPERLVINGSAFGDTPGFVELFYKRIIAEVMADVAPPDPGATRSPTIILSDDLVTSWTDEQITVETSAEQRRVILEGLGVQGFRHLQPFVRVVTATGRRSPAW